MVDALDGFEKRVDRNAWKGSKIVQEDRSTESWEVVAKDGKETCFSGAFKKNTIAGVLWETWECGRTQHCENLKSDTSQLKRRVHMSFLVELMTFRPVSLL